jgi:hypothetical protein
MNAKALVDLVGRRGQVNPRAYAIMIVLARGWLIERARSKRLREELAAAEAEVAAMSDPSAYWGAV